MNKRFALILLVIIAVFGGIFLATGSKNSPGDASKLSNHVKGSGSTGITLVEYGDFQCPACGSYYPTLKQVFDKYKDQIRFQFRNYPLSSIHQNAYAGARAAEAADKQGKYWEMNDILYEENVKNIQAQQQGQVYSSWLSAGDPTSYFNGYASQLKLDLAKFKADYVSEAVNDTIKADISEGQKLDIASTPTFFLDGKKLNENPANNVDAFGKLIDDAIALKTGKSSGSTPGDSSGSSTPGPSSSGSAEPAN